MELRFAHLADYAAADAAGKLTIVGTFDIVWDQLKTRPIPFPPCYLVASFAANLAEGTEHDLEIALVDADEKPVMDRIQGKLQFRPFGPGYPLRSNLLIGFGQGPSRSLSSVTTTSGSLLMGIRLERSPSQFSSPSPRLDSWRGGRSS